MYIRLIIVTIIGLLTSRYLLQALGANDFGLYSVVGGLIALLNVLSTAMTTTTRRFVNVEMGKPDGNLNRIFNISRLLHVGFAIFVVVIAELIGLFYIYHFLNVEPDRIADAVFVFQVSVFASAFGIYTVPFQSLLEAHERFTAVALIDILKCVLGICLVLALFLFENERIRIYSVGMGLITITLLFVYTITCRRRYKEIVKFKYYKEKKSYRDIIVFNNYISIGALSYMSRSQGSTILINYFFGTLVNAAFAIGYMLETYCMSFVSNIGSAAAPQITSNFENNNDRSLNLTATLHRLSVYLMLLLVVPISLELNFVLNIWLKDVPEGALLISQLTLISALSRVVFGGVEKYIQASGKIKWFQLVCSTAEILCLFIGFLLFRIGFESYSIIIVYILCTIFNCIVSFVMLKQLLGFNLSYYLKAVYVSVIEVLLGVALYVFLYTRIQINSTFGHLLGIIISLFVVALIVYMLGTKKGEREALNKGLVRIFGLKKK